VTFQASGVLSILSVREATDEDMARELDMPEPSVRRAATELSKLGYRIVRPGRGAGAGGRGSAFERAYRLL
jgi:Mn-dependent DtxR family transcriptional regulator